MVLHLFGGVILMILEGLINIFVSFIDFMISGVSVFTLPLDMISAVSTLGAFGSWIVGSDLLMMVGACIFHWTVIKITVGVVLFVYRLIPFI